MTNYLKSEQGAVTVDWVVLTASLVGLGLAVAGVVSVGVQDTSGDIKGQMDGTIIYSAFSSAGSSEDFSGGAGDWIGASVETINGFGEVFGNIGGDGSEQIYGTFDFSEHEGSAKFDVDLLALNSFNGDDAVIYVDGVEVARGTLNSGGQGNVEPTLDWTFNTSTGVTVTPTIKASGSDIDSSIDPGHTGAQWNDTVIGLEIAVADPSDSMTLGFGADTDEPITNESLAIDNVSVTKIHNGLGG